MLLSALGWLAVVILILANGLFVAAEFGLTSVDRYRLARHAEDGDRRADVVLNAAKRLSFQLSGAQLGITISSLLLGFVAQPVIAEALRPAIDSLGAGGATEAVAVVVALILATVAQMLFGELIPQNIALARPVRTTRFIVPVLVGFTKIFAPVISAFNGAANAVVRLLGVEPQEELRSARTAPELGQLIMMAGSDGSLPATTARLLRRALSFGDKTAADVMTPRVDVTALDGSASASDLLSAARRTGHSRFPVHRGDLDVIDGVVHIKHAFALPPEARDHTRVTDLMVEAVKVPTTLRGEPLLHTLRRGELQLGIVIDEFGGTAGVVTVEDLVEEITGQIRDEYDLGEEPDVVRLSNGAMSVSGRLHRDLFGELFGWEPLHGPFDTLAGLVLARLGHLPDLGEEVSEQGWTLEVTKLDGRRIDRVLVAPAVADDLDLLDES